MPPLRPHANSGIAACWCRDDPAILAWGLANEPRCAGDARCVTVAGWAHGTATFLKALDPHHLVTVVRGTKRGWLADWVGQEMVLTHVNTGLAHKPPIHAPIRPPLLPQDSEGFLGPTTPEACRFNPYNCAQSGCDFAGEAASPAIDFACCHLYPELWLPQADEQVREGSAG